MTNEAKKRLLVVDDERGFREYIRDAAGGLGYEVEMATNGLEAREIYKRFQPDVILLDVVMPEADGVEFTRWLALQQTKARIILVTGLQPALRRFNRQTRHRARYSRHHLSDQAAPSRHPLGRAGRLSRHLARWKFRLAGAKSP